MSPFYDPTRPSSPAWDFGEATLPNPGSRGGSRGGADSRSGSRGGSRGAATGSARPSGWAETADGRGDGTENGPEETELLDYTSLGQQTVSHRATSPAHAFSRDGLASESGFMFQAEKRPEPGPGSFQPNLSATSTHPGPRCGVSIGHRGSSGGGDGGDCAGRGGMAGNGGLPRPGPGHYSTWDSIGRQVLSTRPSSPTVLFATGEWELR